MHYQHNITYILIFMHRIFPVLFLFSKRMEKYRREEERNLDRNLEEEDEAKERRTGMREKKENV